MKSSIMALLMMVSILIIAGRSNGRMLMKNDLFIVPDSLSSFDPNLDALVNDDSSLHTPDGHMEKDELECVQDMISSSSAKSSTNENKLSFGISPSVRKTDIMESSALNTGKGVDSMVMISRHKPQSRNLDTINSHHSNGDEHLKPKKSNKRKLGSSPSPGGGN